MYILTPAVHQVLKYAPKLTLLMVAGVILRLV